MTSAESTRGLIQHESTRSLTVVGHTDGRYPVATDLQLSAYLRALRKTRGLTQAQLGDMLGVSKARVSEIERDPSNVAFSQLQRIVGLLGARIIVETRPPAEPATTDRHLGGEW